MSEISSLEQNLIFKKIDTETINVQIDHNPTLMAIVGEFNKNLKELEKITGTKIFFRGNSITCKGKALNLEEFTQAIKFLADKYFLTKVIEKEDIILSAKGAISISPLSIFLSILSAPNNSYNAS